MRSFVLRCSVLSVALLSPILTLACGSSSHADPDANVVQSSLARDTSPAVSADDAAKLAIDDTTFALNLYHQLDAPNTNLVYSPYSVSVAAAMGMRSSIPSP